MNTRRKQILSIIGALSLSTQVAAANNEVPEVPEIEWDTTLNKFQFDKKKFIGQRFSVSCAPAEVDQNFTGGFGTDVYASKTPICLAALHAGRITAEGGSVTLQLNPGQDEYAGSVRNGVTTATLPGTKRSYVFVDAEAGMDEVQAKYIPRIKWDTKFTKTGFAYKQFIGQKFTFRCPKAPARLRPTRVVGTDSYAYATVICRAAVHAGAITTTGGIVTVQMGYGDRRLVGSIRNDVETHDGSAGLRSLFFVNNGTQQQG
ncbi:MAG: hypothetical protein K0U93_13020 [Gammaproteobacteria bacterium]|nr:hypothetical protein [Gammaproteobacteria bacterium]